MTSKHTPTPWIVRDGATALHITNGITAASTHIASITMTDHYRPATADAALIVKAVNCHDELLEALEDLAGYENPSGMEYDESLEKARAVIAKAQGE